MPAAHERVHATAIAVGSSAVLIRGPSGAGKSDLALRCLSLPVSGLLPQQPRLVADDQVILSQIEGTLRAQAPDTTRGLLEVRGLGILNVSAVELATIRLVADLVHPTEIERMPEDCEPVTLCGVAVPHFRIAPFEHSAPIKLLLALLRV